MPFSKGGVVSIAWWSSLISIIGNLPDLANVVSCQLFVARSSDYVNRAKHHRWNLSNRQLQDLMTMHSVGYLSRELSGCVLDRQYTSLLSFHVLLVRWLYFDRSLLIIVWYSVASRMPCLDGFLHVVVFGAWVSILLLVAPCNLWCAWPGVAIEVVEKLKLPYTFEGGWAFAACLSLKFDAATIITRKSVHILQLIGSAMR